MTRSIVSGAGVVGRIRDQHAEIRLGFEEVAAAAPSARGAAFAPLRRLLALHETAEEIVVYPSVVAADRQAVAAVHARKAEERRAKVALADLESMDPSSAAFADRFDEFRADVEAHAAAEEVEVLPVLEARHRAGMLEHLDRVFVAVQAIAPTHAHRFAPVGAVGNLAIGPVVGALDRTRDFLEQHRR